jgi:hypothetical protein
LLTVDGLDKGLCMLGNLQNERKDHGSITNHVPRFSFLVRFLQSLRASACCIDTVHTADFFLAIVFSLLTSVIARIIRGIDHFVLYHRL